MGKVRDSSIPRPETLESIEALMKQQEAIVVQLNKQRSNIVSMLQRGRLLAKTSDGPTFVEKDVMELEAEWEKAFTGTMEKLEQLKGISLHICSR